MLILLMMPLFKDYSKGQEGLALGEESLCSCLLEENSDKEIHKNKSVWQRGFLISLPDALIFSMLLDRH